MKKTTLSALTAVIVCALIPRPGEAQIAGVPEPSVAGSTRGSALGFIGITNLRCNCTFRTDDDGTRSFTFRSNPVVLGVYDGSPADGALERGDTITAIDGYALTSTEGGNRLANVRPNQRLTLNVTRGKAHMTLLIKTTSSVFGSARGFGSRTPRAEGTWSYDFPAIPAIPAEAPLPPEPAIPARTPRPAELAAPRASVYAVRPPSGTGVWAIEVPSTPPAAPAAPVAGFAIPATPATPAIAPMPPIPVPTGWFGFAIRCSDCGWSQERDDDSPVWESESPPELSMISRGGPADRAGLLAGDRITHVNGVSILTKAGARAFGRVRPGQRVRLTVLRDGRPLTRELTLATRPEVRAALAATTVTPVPAMKRELRYTGKLDNVSVEVWSAAGPVVDKSGDTITITVGTTVVRLKAK